LKAHSMQPTIQFDKNCFNTPIFEYMINIKDAYETRSQKSLNFLV